MRLSWTAALIVCGLSTLRGEEAWLGRAAWERRLPAALARAGEAGVTLAFFGKPG